MKTADNAKPLVRVLLAAHGEAETAGMVENFRVSWITLKHAAEVMRLPAPLRLLVCTFAACRKRLTGGTRSPHNENTRRQVAALQAQLDHDSGAHYRVEPIFASTPPYLDEQLCPPDNVDHQIVLSMIPTDSRLSCGLICQAQMRLATRDSARIAVMARLWEAQDLIAIHCAHIIEHFPSIKAEHSSCLLLVLHGTIVAEKNGQPPDFHAGVEEKRIYGDALKAELLAMPDRRWNRVEIAYLNHGVGGQWSSPTLNERLNQLAAEGIDSVAAYACEHLVDGSETINLPCVLKASSIPETYSLPCLNDAPQFIDFLADLIGKALAAPESNFCCDSCPLGGKKTG